MTPQERLKIFYQERQAQGGSAEERRRVFLEEQAAKQQPPAERSAFQALGGGLAEGFSEYLVSPAASLVSAVGSAATGDFAPLGEMAESVGRGFLKTASAFDPVNAEQTYATVSAEQDPRLAELRARGAQRQAQAPAGRFIQRRRAELAAAAEGDKSLTNKIARGAGQLTMAALPATVAGVATGGSLPAIATTTALQSAAQPENAALNVGMSVIPLPVGQAVKAGASAVRRVLGKGAAQAIEAEAAAIPGSMRSTLAREIAEEAIPGPTAPIQAATGEAIPAVAPQKALQSAFQKLETDNVEQIGAMIANANRRYRQSSTPEQIQSSLDDFERLNRLTLDEQRALSKVLPARTVSPVVQNYGGKGPYSRDISDISASEVDAQLDANLRDLEQFFGGQKRAPDFDFPEPNYEVAPPSFEVKAAPDLPYTETVGPRAPEPMGMSARVTGPASPSAALNAAVSEATDAIPLSVGQRIKNEFLGALGAPKSLKSAFDISAPFRQGGLLALRPLQWRQAAKAWANQFRAFKTKNFEAINEAIAAHPDAQVMKDSGLFLANRTGEGLRQGEEAFLRRSGSKISETVGKIPGVKHSDQAYTTFLDTQRVEAFSQYKRLIDKAGLSPEEAMKGYQAAAQWINIATGRGSLGQRFDKAFDALNFFFFSPRYIASRLNVFNPVMYARNASSPGGRVVLKQQMADLMQFAGTVAATMYLAKAAGAEVGLNPNSPDFLKIRVGNWRYDTLAGLQQVMRLIYRVGADIGRAGRGEKPKFGKSAIDIAETFLSYKLSPPAAVFRNFINQRTPDKKPFTAGGAVADLVAPMQWADFVEAYQKEGWGGVGMASPGFVGFGAQLQVPSPQDAAIEKARPLYSELLRLDKKVSDLRRADKEDDATYNTRVRMFADNYSQYGLKLVGSPRFQNASDEVKKIALDRLNEQAKKLTLQQFPFPALMLDANELMDGAESSKRNPARK